MDRIVAYALRSARASWPRRAITCGHYFNHEDANRGPQHLAARSSDQKIIKGQACLFFPRTSDNPYPPLLKLIESRLVRGLDCE
jgi:hypothetical protein